MAGNANSGKLPNLTGMRLAARLRRRGLTLHAIGLQLGLTKQAVHLLLRAYRRRRANLASEQILAWADNFHARYGRWPQVHSGRIHGGHGLTWLAVDHALAHGGRGLPGGSSLMQLLAEHRQVRNRYRLPTLTERQILTWADAHHHRTGRWPDLDSGPIPEAPGETWRRVQTALVEGLRGLPGGSSLPRLLLAERGVRKRTGRLRGPRHSEAQIVAWAQAHRSRTGR
jgi:hypothetical protein